MQLDDSAWPILRIRMGALQGAATFDAMTSWYAARLQRAHEEDVFLYVLTDGEGTLFDLELVRHVARWQRSLTRKDLDRCVLSVVVDDSPASRQLLTALHWFSRPLARIAVVAGEAEGWRAIVDDHARRGLSLPPPPVWLSRA